MHGLCANYARIPKSKLALGLCTDDEIDNPSLTIQSSMHGLCANYARMPTWERPLGRAQTTAKKKYA